MDFCLESGNIYGRHEILPDGVRVMDWEKIAKENAITVVNFELGTNILRSNQQPPFEEIHMFQKIWIILSEYLWLTA